LQQSNGDKKEAWLKKLGEYKKQESPNKIKAKNH